MLFRSPETVQSIEDALRIAAERDAELAALSATAQYAGEADPYRKPAEDEADDDLDTGARPQAPPEA